MRNSLVAILVTVSVIVSCAPEKPKPSTLFQVVPGDVSGITFANELEDSDAFNIIDYLYYYNGGGLAVGDINNDGLEDLYFSANMRPNKLYLNKGNLKFEDITEQAGVSSVGPWKTGVTMADVNADGLLDIYLCRVGAYKGISGHNELYINNGDNTFTESAADYGLDFSGFSTQAAFFDYDLDGDLDMYLLNHSVHTSRSYGRVNLRQESDGLAGDRLYKNNQGIFIDVTASSGIYNSQIGYGLGLAISDVNLDGWPDIYVSNDFHENDYLYLNNQDGTFTESIKKMIGHTSRFSMGNSIADLNNDQNPEIMTLDMLPDDEEVLKNSAGEDPFEIYKLKLEFGYESQFARNSLQLNNGNGTFSDVALMRGVAATDWSWSPLMADFDLDGYKDLFITNGIVKRPNDLDYVSFLSGNNISAGNLDNNSKVSDQALIQQMPDGKVANRIFQNIDGIQFTDKTGEWIADIPTYSTAGAYADLDQDGDLDIVVNNINDPAMIYVNLQATSNNYLKFSLNGPSGNPFGIGTKIKVYASAGVLTQEVHNVRGFQSSGSLQSVFGLGSDTEVDSVVIAWPGSKSQILKNVKANQTLKLDYGKAVSTASVATNIPKPYFTRLEDFNMSFTHRENNFVDFNHQSLIPHTISREGPKISVSDMDKDGMSELYVTGASGQAGALLSIGAEATSMLDPRLEETNSLLFDADGDGDDDLLVITGGNEYSDRSPLLQDYLLLNDGKGVFEISQGAIPYLNSHSSVAVPADMDQDGDMDLFVGGRVMSSRYGLIPSSYLLINDGLGKFSVQENRKMRYIGMITDAAWGDLDGNGYPDLIVVGEWMPVKVFMNESGLLTETTVESLSGTNGWWNCLEKIDVDGDGDQDFVIGNEGHNNKLKPSNTNPVRMYVNDFDGNGYLDQIITYSVDGEEYPVANRDELGKQMPMIKKSFTNYRDFSGKQVSEVLNKESLDKGLKYEVTEFSSIVLINNGNMSFTIKELPEMAQISPIYAIEPFDVNRDGNLDLITAGNKTWANTYFGASDASHGQVLINDGLGNFEVIAQGQAGLNVWGDVRDIAHLSIEGKDYFVFGVNDKPMEVYVYNQTLNQ